MTRVVDILPKGTTFVRAAIATAVAKNDIMGAGEYAGARWGDGSQISRVMKAAVAAGTAGGSTWGGELVGEAGTAAAEFIAAVRAQSIIGRMAGLRRVPFQTPILAQTGIASAAWVGEYKPIPLTKMGWDRKTMQTLKVAAMCVVSNELLRSTDPSAEAFIRTDLIKAVAAASDEAFIDPANAGVGDEMPASVLHGVTPMPSTGDFENDVKRLIAGFTGDLSAAYFVGKGKLFAQIAGTTFPNVGARGGEILGVPALASDGVPNDGDGSYQLSLVDPTGITFTANDAAAQIKTTSQAMIDMRDDPTLPPGPDQQLVSLFQVEGTAIAALLHENWEVQRAGSAAILTGIAPLEASE